MVTKTERILTPTDFSHLSEGGLKAAAQIARLHGARLILLHVLSRVETESISESYFPRRPLDEVFNDLKRALVEHFEKVVPLEDRQGVILDTVVREGIAHQEILKASQEQDADLIVMATHGRTGLAHMVMGSVAEKVIRQAACPVMTVRPAKEAF